MRLIALRSVFLCTLALSSKVAWTASAPSSSDTSDGDCASGQGVPLPPHVTHNGIAVTRPITETVELEEGRSVSMRSLHDDPELQLTYVHGLVGEDEIADLVRLAEARQGWVRSPLKTQGAGELLESDHRNSSSCPMLWPLVYDSRREELAARNPLLIDELDLVSHLMHRVAALFSATGMEVSARHIEPLQLVRYAATERFGPHHDYHEYNADGKLGSSVQGEQRAFTVLVFGATLGPDAGGETYFPNLDVSVAPRLGDALVWANVGADGAPNPRSLHEGRPPAAGNGKLAINVWVCDREFTTSETLERVVRT